MKRKNNESTDMHDRLYVMANAFLCRRWQAPRRVYELENAYLYVWGTISTSSEAFLVVKVSLSLFCFKNVYINIVKHLYSLFHTKGCVCVSNFYIRKSNSRTFSIALSLVYMVYMFLLSHNCFPSFFIFMHCRWNKNYFGFMN